MNEIEIRRAARIAEQERLRVRREKEAEGSAWRSSRAEGRGSNSFGGAILAIGVLALIGFFNSKDDVKSPTAADNSRPAVSWGTSSSPNVEPVAHGGDRDSNVAFRSDGSAHIDGRDSVDIGSAAVRARSDAIAPVVAAPSLVKRIPPRYPPQAIRQHHQGTAVLNITVETDGSVSAVSIAQSTGYRELDRSAMDAAKKWMFVPATQEGRAVATTVRMPVSYSLETL